MSRAMQTMDEAVAAMRPVDRLGSGLGPAHPSSFLHALAARTDWTDLTIYGALLIDLFEVFTRPGVHHQSGFFGPAERFLIASGADIQFVPADFRRFAPVLERVAPRVVATVATPPDADGYWLIEHIRSHPSAVIRGLPALAVTAYVRQEDEQRARLAGFQEHVRKPIDVDALRGTEIPQSLSSTTNTTGSFHNAARLSDSWKPPWFAAPSPVTATAMAPLPLRWKAKAIPNAGG